MKTWAVPPRLHRELEKGFCAYCKAGELATMAMEFDLLKKTTLFFLSQSAENGDRELLLEARSWSKWFS
jgi:hypothetical protein